MESRTTSLVDRRLLELVVPAIPGDVSEEVIKAHLADRARSHNLIRELLRTNPNLVDLEAYLALLRRGVSEFKDPGVLEQVRGLGGQFREARLTSVSGGETFDDQRNHKVVKFWTDWQWKREERKRLTIGLSIASQVIYLPTLVEGSLRCTYDKTEEEGRLYLEEILAQLPKVAGLRWIVGNPPTVTRVLANHLRETGEHLLTNLYTWTTGGYQNPQYGLRRLVVGCFDADGVYVDHLRPVDWHDFVGLFVLGVPE